jgi:hypothetical protein
MKPHFIDPERLKSLIESAKVDLGLSPDVARSYVTQYLREEGVRYQLDSKHSSFAWRFGKPLAAPSLDSQLSITSEGQIK